MAQEILVFVSCPQSAGAIIARTIVDEKLAACVSLLPSIESYYSWQGQLCQENETLLLIKSNKLNYPQLEKRLKELHSYEVPEILALDIVAGNQAYLDWLNFSLAQAEV